MEQNILVHAGRPTREDKRFDMLTYEALGEIYAAAGRLGYPFGPAYRLMILTLATREEVASVRLADLSADRNEPVDLPLSNETISGIAELKQRNRAGLNA